MNGSRVISASIPADLLDRIHERAQQEDRSNAALIRQALRQYLDADAPFERRWGSRNGGTIAATDGNETAVKPTKPTGIVLP